MCTRICQFGGKHFTESWNINTSREFRMHKIQPSHFIFEESEMPNMEENWSRLCSKLVTELNKD
jgi:hypothetical protein